MQPASTTRQDLLAREGLTSLLALAGLGLTALIWPLGPVNPQADTTGAPAPWLFLGLQELLRLLPAFWAGLVLPGLALLLLAVLPWLAGGPGPETPAWGRRPGAAELAAWLTLAGGAALTIAGWHIH